MLFGCYRAVEANDPQMFVAAAATVLEQFSPSVGRAVCGPLGLPSQLKFLPSIAEISEACKGERDRQNREVHSKMEHDRKMAERERVMPPRQLSSIDMDKNPWLMNAKTEIIDGVEWIPTNEIYRCWERSRDTK